MSTIAKLEVKKNSLKVRIKNLADDPAGKWVTVRGRRVFIKEGQSFDDALKAAGASHRVNPARPKQPDEDEMHSTHIPGSGSGKDHPGFKIPPPPADLKAAVSLTSAERKLINEKDADKQIDTGMDPNSHSESLDIYYSGDRTIGVPSGEHEKPFAIPGKKTPAAVLSYYKRERAKK